MFYSLKIKKERAFAKHVVLDAGFIWDNKRKCVAQILSFWYSDNNSNSS